MRIKRNINYGTTTAIIISAIALLVSVYEASLNRKQQNAMIWPYLDVELNYSTEGFAINSWNKGTGPAIIKYVEIQVKEKAVNSYNELFDVAYPERKIGYDFIRTSRLYKSVYSANEKRELIFIPWSNEGKILINGLKTLHIKINYCDVFDNCWIYEWPKNSRREVDNILRAKVEFKN